MTDLFVRAIADAVLERMTPLLLAPRTRLLTIEEAATYLGRTPKAIRHLIQAGAFPHVKGDSRVMLDVNDLDLWIEWNKS